MGRLAGRENVRLMNGSGLALFRRGLGLLCVLDACFRLFHSSFWLSDLGVLPRSLYFRMFEDSLCWSVYSISARPEIMVVLLLASIAIGSFQLVRPGISPRWTRVVLWMLMLSVQQRNPALTDSADVLLRSLLFWDMLLPDTVEPETEVAGPVVMGLQLQLTLALAFLNWYLTPAAWSQATMWSMNPRAQVMPWLWIVVKLGLGLLVVAVWVRRARMPALAVSTAVLLAWAVCLHPILPLTVGAACLCLYSPAKEPQRKTQEDPWATPISVVATLLIVGQFVPGVQVMMTPLAQLAGLEQSYSRSYPLASSEISEFVARDSSTGQTLWVLDSQADRRSRLWADKAGQKKIWTARLVDALKYRFEPTGDVAVWTRKLRLQPDGSLNPSELELILGKPGAERARP